MEEERREDGGSCGKALGLWCSYQQVSVFVGAKKRVPKKRGVRIASTVSGV